MAHYAELDDNNIVLRVIVVRTEDTLDENGNESETVANSFLYANGITGRFIRTSYNTYGGNHVLGGTPFRKNYAGIEFTYDAQRDAFVTPKPPDDPNNPNRYTLNEETCQWDDTLERTINIGVARI
jgi:hypothetical protein